MKTDFFSSKKRSALLLIILAALVITALICLVLREDKPPHDGETQSTTEDKSTISFPVILPDPDDLTQDIDPSDDSSTPITPFEVTWEPSAISDSYQIDGETVFFASINQPVFAGLDSTVCDTINSALEDYCRTFIKITSDDRLLAEEAYQESLFGFEPYERSGDYTVFVRDNMISVLFNLFHENGGADTASEKKSLTFDMTTGKAVSFADYIGKDEAFGRNYLLTVVGQMIGNTPDKFYTDALDILTATLNLNDFYLTESALVLFFNPDVLAPSAHGLVTLEIPYSQLGK